MSRKELVLLVSRAFSLLLIILGFVEVTYLPARLLTFSHHLNQASVLATHDYHDYLTKFYLITGTFHVVRILGLFLAAALFWKCGPRVEALFSSQQDNRETSW